MKRRALSLLSILALLLIVPLFGLVGAAVADVVLTTPEAVRSELGGSSTVNYDRIRTLSISVNPVSDTVTASFELYASSDAARPPFRGTYRVDATASTASIEIERLGVETGLTLTGPQAAATVTFIDDFVATVEGSMDTFGLVAGTQQ